VGEILVAEFARTSKFSMPPRKSCDFRYGRATVGHRSESRTDAPPTGRRRRGFSLIEALISLTLIGLAGALLLLATETSVQATADAVEQTQAAGMARQLVDEVLGHRYMSQGVTPYQTVLCANSWEAGGQGRERFNDTDDFNGFQAQPVEDTWGVELGRGDWLGYQRAPGFQLREERFRRWSEEIEVYYVSEDDPRQRLSTGHTSNLRAVDVRIYRDTTQGSPRELARLRRVYAYLPPPQ
jgi:prepilin-type N-terminal cleavage/methylation domain-containing protein